jgi:hypothetical protein
MYPNCVREVVVTELRRRHNIIVDVGFIPQRKFDGKYHTMKQRAREERDNASAAAWELRTTPSVDIKKAGEWTYHGSCMKRSSEGHDAPRHIKSVNYDTSQEVDGGRESIIQMCPFWSWLDLIVPSGNSNKRDKDSDLIALRAQNPYFDINFTKSAVNQKNCVCCVLQSRWDRYEQPISFILASISWSRSFLLQLLEGYEAYRLCRPC